MSVVPALDASPVNIVRSMRGSIVEVRTAYPQVLHVKVRDSAGGVWRLASQDAGWLPRDASRLVGRSVNGVQIDEGTGELRCELSDGSFLTVLPAGREASDDPPSWELLTPDGLALEFGPGLRWQIASADAQASPRG